MPVTDKIHSDSEGKNPFDSSNIKALAQGDTKAFDSLFIYLFPKVKYFILGLIKNESVAEDLAQDVFVKIWLKRELLITTTNINNYIYRIARNIVYDYLEKEILHTNSLYDTDETLFLEQESITEILYAEELDTQVKGIVSRMPSQRKTIYEMSRTEGLSNEEIARRLSISKRTVEAHLFAALSDIRKVLSFVTLFFF